MVLLGAALAAADSFPPRLRFGAFLGEIAGDENTYFERSLAELGVAEVARAKMPDNPATAALDALLREAAASGDYAAMLAVLCVAEGIYLEWASSIRPPLPTSFVHAEWIRLHDNPDFVSVVEFLRSELDRVGPAAEETARDFFSRAVALELAFFDDAYAHPYPGA